jgi:hypothetical protein
MASTVPQSDNSTSRLIYNYDGWGAFLRGQTPEAVRESIDILADSQITTVMLSPNIGQSVNYPSDVSELCHWRPLSAETQATLEKGMGPIFSKLTYGVADLWRKHGIDSYQLMVDRAREHGLEVFASIRMNDVHMVELDDGEGPYTDPFYRAHPEWRLLSECGRNAHGALGLNYAIPEVRAHRLALMEELLRRYDLDGLDLDFQRGSPYFPSDRPDLEWDDSRWPHYPRDLSEKGAPIMNQFLEEIRAMTERVGRERGRDFVLSARVPSTLSGCRRVGLDPVAWHQNGSLDFLTVSRFLQIYFDLPLEEFRRVLPGLPVHACIEHTVGASYENGHGYSRNVSPEIYRGAIAAAYAQGAAGITLYNMFVFLGKGLDPDGKDWSHLEPKEIFQEVGDPQTLEGTDKLYLIDAIFPFFDLRFFDSHAPLPASVTPDSPLMVPLIVCEKDPASRRMTLRVVLDEPKPGLEMAVQLNGRTQGPAYSAVAPTLFEEPYNQKPPQLECCIDFTVDGSVLFSGRNEVSVMASAPITIVSIELAVTNA